MGPSDPVTMAPREFVTRLLSAAIRTGSCLLAINLGACQMNEAPGTPDGPKAMPFGLSCDRCMYGHVQDCGWAADAPMIAVVSGSQDLDSHRYCLGEPGPESPAVCIKEHLYQFASARFIRNDLGASETDSFEAVTSYEEVQTSEMELSPATGVNLEADARYVIFAVRDRKDMGRSADWYINLACALHDGEEPGAIP
jgi:hypothetical protein